MAWAEDWDRVGLVIGDPEQAVEHVLVTVDVTEEVVAEALDKDIDLIVAHHPLMLAGVHSVAATSAQGRIVHELIKNDVALYTAHTNADVASPGVSDALAIALGVDVSGPLVPTAGAPQGVGLGRWGRLDEETPLAEFLQTVSARLVGPIGSGSSHSIRSTGDPSKSVEVVAVCGGSGDSVAAYANAVGADVLVTGDLKHHRTLDHDADNGCVLIDAGHWATEFPWCEQAADLLEEDARRAGFDLSAQVTETCTDPWTLIALTQAAGDEVIESDNEELSV